MVIDDMNALYSSIEGCIESLIRSRVEKDEAAVSCAHRRMESLMVATQQELRVIADYLTNKD